MLAVLNTSDLWPTLIASLSGISFAGLGTAYKLGQTRGISTAHVVLGVSIVGAAACAPALAESAAPWPVYLVGVVAGLTQYLTIRLIARGLAVSSLSVVWCVVALSFLPVIPYTCILFQKSLVPPQYFALASAVACVFLASFGRSSLRTPSSLPVRVSAGPSCDPAPPDCPVRPQSRALVLGVLVAVLLCNSVSNMIQSHLSLVPAAGEKFIDRYGSLWMFILYATIAFSAFVDLGLRRKLKCPFKIAALLGLGGGLCSVCGIRLQNLVAGRPMTYAMNGAVGIVAAAVLSVLLFRERPTRWWWGIIAFGVAAVALGA